MSTQTPIQGALEQLAEGQDIDAACMEQAMTQIMRGQATPAQIGGFLMALRVKGETVEEIAAAAQVMRQFATAVETGHSGLVDTCGTGGDGSGIFNVSTACAFVLAAAGGRVAKHGNRSVSSKSGSADVLEAAGVRLDISPGQVAQCIDQLGVGFLFAPAHHGAVRHAVAPRAELGLRTLFNLLGPMTNPAGATRQVMGVYQGRWVEPVAQVLHKLGSEHVMVVHANDGLDEISLAAPTQIAEARMPRDEIAEDEIAKTNQGCIRSYSVAPEDFDIPSQSLTAIQVNGPQQSLELIRSALSGDPGPAADIVALNSGAAIYVAGLAPTLSAGVTQAQQVLASGAALQRLEQLAQLTTELANVSAGDNPDE